MATVVGQVTNSGEIGVIGDSAQFEGVRGTSHAENHGGVVGINDNQTDAAGAGVFGESTKGEGVRGISHSPFHGGVVGTCDNEAAGVFGESTRGEGVRGVSHSAEHGAVVGTNDNASGVGIFGKGGRLAGQFEGNVDITGNLTIQGVSISVWFQRIIALEQRDNSQQQQIISLSQQINNLQQQLASLQQKEIADRQDEVTGIQILAARVTALGG
jgi:hypothetical protein